MPAGDAPLPLGQWLELKGLVGLPPRGSTRGFDEDDVEDGVAIYQRHAAVAPLFDRAVGPLGGAGGAGGTRPIGLAAGGSSFHAAPQRPRKREREELPYSAPDLPGQVDLEAWLQQQRGAFEAAVEAAALAGKHSAIFMLVYSLLEGEDRRRVGVGGECWVPQPDQSSAIGVGWGVGAVAAGVEPAGGRGPQARGTPCSGRR